MRVFIVRPFGTKKDIDFDAVEVRLIRPALAKLEWEGGTTGEFVHAGDIKSDMMQQLLLADVVIADISIHNPNVFYELGVRHALRDKATVMLYSKSDDVPFDIRGDRYVAYDKSLIARSSEVLSEQEKKALASSVELLCDTLRATVARTEADSPVFRLLPLVKPHDLAKLVPVPVEAVEAIDIARDRGDVGQLALIAGEVSDKPWAYNALLPIGHALFASKAWKLAMRVYEAALEARPRDAEANLRLSTIYHRVDDLARSNAAVKRVTSLTEVDAKQRCEAFALRGRNYKTAWIQSWSKTEELAERQRLALASPLLEDSAQSYFQGFLLDPLSYYAGVNALAMFSIQVQLATAHREVWNSKWNDDGEADFKLNQLKRRCDQLQHCVPFACEASKPAQGEDAWRVMTVADYAVLRGDAAQRVESAYKHALGYVPGDFNPESAARQLVLYRKLGLFEVQVAAALRALGVQSDLALIEPHKPKGVVIVGTGHRIDLPDRPTPRFPTSREAAVRKRIKAEIAAAIEGVEGRKLGIAAAANGADTMFHEVCAELGVETKVLLPLAVDEFRKQSVVDGGSSWVRRFDAICDRNKARILGDKDKLPKWVTDGRYGVFQRGNIWMIESAAGVPDVNLMLLAVWDGAPSGGEGGTAEMVKFAKSRGAEVRIVSPLDE